MSVTVNTTCVKCGSPVVADGYCKDESCPYSDWPQGIPLEDLHSLPQVRIERKHGVKKRSESERGPKANLCILVQGRIPVALPHGYDKMTEEELLAWGNERLLQIIKDNPAMIQQNLASHVTEDEIGVGMIEKHPEGPKIVCLSCETPNDDLSEFCFECGSTLQGGRVIAEDFDVMVRTEEWRNWQDDPGASAKIVPAAKKGEAS